VPGSRTGQVTQRRQIYTFRAPLTRFAHGAGAAGRRASRWKTGPDLTNAQRADLAAYETLIAQLRQVNSDVLAVAAELSHGTIETVLAKSDLQHGGTATESARVPVYLMTAALPTPQSWPTRAARARGIDRHCDEDLIGPGGCSGVDFPFEFPDSALKTVCPHTVEQGFPW
jgi:hypothetical protein